MSGEGYLIRPELVIICSNDDDHNDEDDDSADGRAEKVKSLPLDHSNSKRVDGNHTNYHRTSKQYDVQERNKVSRHTLTNKGNTFREPLSKYILPVDMKKDIDRKSVV